MTTESSRRDFESEILPHMDAAYNLARWLMRDGQDVEDVVQEAYLRAFRFFGGFRGGNARAWLLKIVRNAFYSWVQNTRRHPTMSAFEEEIDSGECSAPRNPETLRMQADDGRLVRRALQELPPNFRELLVLRELEGLSYKEIADVADIPLGTVMSSLSRARERLRKSLSILLREPASCGSVDGDLVEGHPDEAVRNYASAQQQLGIPALHVEPKRGEDNSVWQIIGGKRKLAQDVS